MTTLPRPEFVARTNEAHRLPAVKPSWRIEIVQDVDECAIGA
jgi:hypothetical protein